MGEHGVSLPLLGVTFSGGLSQFSVFIIALGVIGVSSIVVLFYIFHFILMFFNVEYCWCVGKLLIFRSVLYVAIL